MSEHLSGKTFSTPEEAGVTLPNSDAIAEILRAIDESKQLRDSIPPDQRILMSPKFSDDLSDTEFAGPQERHED
ncbi:hypothetical protein D5S18_13940 [Nocardia panacis]|uniref:Uncharacterized protein n=1 Tax=Nocardia panacis TaxID=2340916 RepID=A0A3A4JY99_9NOCA|nr:hypothetical protein [Nocardia panacis]RJO75867.1 hypothetical protein D5S18_13940 [Nocardia panacis]